MLRRAWSSILLRARSFARTLLRDHPLKIAALVAALITLLGLLLLILKKVQANFAANIATELVGIGVSALITMFIVEQALSAHERTRWSLPRERLLQELRPSCGITLIRLETIFQGFDSVIHGTEPDLFALDVVSCATFRDEFVKFKTHPDWVASSGRPQVELADTYMSLVGSAYRELGGSYSAYVEPLKSRNEHLIAQDPELFSRFQRIESTIRNWNSMLQLVTTLAQRQSPPHETWEVYVQHGIDQILDCFDAFYELAAYVGGQLGEEVYQSQVYTPKN